MNKIYNAIKAALLSALPAVGLIPNAASAQSPDRNYIYAESILAPIQDTAAIGDLPDSLLHRSVGYFDGLGRPIQNIGIHASPTGADVIQPYTYDKLGRSVRNYLPYTTENEKGYLRKEAFTEQADFYQNAEGITHTLYPFAETEYDDSPLNIAKRQGAPGQMWQLNKPYTVKQAYRPNTADELEIWTFDPQTETAFTDGYYVLGTLTVTTVKDAQNTETRQYTNKSGQTLVSSTQIDNEKWATTRNVYDELGRLRLVVQPEGVAAVQQNGGQLTADLIEKYAFIYRYDEKGRVIEKKVPGAAQEYLIYDIPDRVVLTQDALQRENNQWNFVKYDALGRGIISGIYTDNIHLTQESMQEYAASFEVLFEEKTNNNFETQYGYTNEAFPSQNIEILTVSWYDNYDFNRDGLPDHAYLPDDEFSEHQPTARLRGMITGEMTRILGEEKALYAVPFYDEYGRVIQTQTNHHLENGQDITWTAYAFSGEVLHTKREFCKQALAPIIFNQQADNTRPLDPEENDRWRRKSRRKKLSFPLPSGERQVRQPGRDNTDDLTRKNIKNTENFIPNQWNNPGECITLRNRYTYYPNRLPKASFMQTNNDSEVKLSEVTYNELGQMIRKGLHYSDTSYLQNVDYQYNIRGWLTHINDTEISEATDLFGMELKYNESISKLHAGARYDGTVVAQLWKSRSDSIKRGFGYRYDKNKRLYHAFYAADSKDMPDTWGEEHNRYSTPVIRYDLNGNITKMNVVGQYNIINDEAKFGYTDILKYEYKGNRLMAVNDIGSGKLPNANDFRDNGSKGSSDNPEYLYDAAGNMIEDQNKGLKITYNQLHLPSVIDLGNGNRIENKYDASGSKLQKRVYENDVLISTADYFGGIEYINGGLRFIAHEEGVLIPKNNSFDYLYDYTDHLGNVRLTWKAAMEADTSWLATMEPDNADQEEALFDNIAETRDAEEAYENTYSAKLINQTGPLLTIDTVRQGERYDASVWYFYTPPDEMNNNILPPKKGLNSFNFPLISVDTRTPLPPSRREEITTTDPTTGETHTETILKRPEKPALGIENVRVNLLSALNLLGKKDKNKPQYQQQLEPPVDAALRFELIDTSGNVVKTETVYTGPGGSWKQLAAAFTVDFEADTMRQGTLKVWVENLSDETPVWFDSLYVEALKPGTAEIVQENHYGAFGRDLQPLARHLNGYDKNNYLYNGKELLTTHNLHWSDYGWRNYDTQIGRWHGVDPLAEKYASYSPYAYVLNNPINLIDYDGREVGGGDDDCPECTGTMLEEVIVTHDMKSSSYDVYFLNNYYRSRSDRGGGGYGGYGDSKTGNVYSPDYFNFEGRGSGNRGSTFNDVLIAINEWNPIAIVANSAKGLITGTDFNNSEVSTGDAIFNLATIIPAGKVLKVAKIGLVTRGVAKGGIKAIQAGKYTFTKTAAGHLAKRPYMNSPSTITNIMKSGKGVSDQFFKGGVNYKVPGIFNGSKGVYELGINPKTNTIYHFLFKTIK